MRNCYLATDLETVSQSRGGGAPVWEGGRVLGVINGMVESDQNKLGGRYYALGSSYSGMRLLQLYDTWLCCMNSAEPVWNDKIKM